MKNKYVFVAVMLSAILGISMGLTSLYMGTEEKKEEEFVIVTSFYPMYIATMNIVDGVDGVTLKNLTDPQMGCIHDFQMSPEDMKLLSTADVLIVNGGGIETFVEEISSNYPKLAIIHASKGISLLDSKHEGNHGKNQECELEEQNTHHHHDTNAHVWMSIEKYRKQLLNITKGLSEEAEEFASVFEANRKTYDAQLAELELRQKQMMESLEQESVIILHSAFDYVAYDYHMKTTFCMDLDAERQVSAGELAKILSEIKENKVHYIFAEKNYSEDMCETIQNEVDVQLVYLDTLNRGEYLKDSYLKGMLENIKSMEEALLQE